MKIKHLIFWHFFIAALLILFACNVFGLGKCQINAFRQAKKYEKRYEIRYGHGWYKGERHMWCEYKDNGVWLMTKDTINYVNSGWKVEDYGGYEVIFYGYPEKASSN